VVLPKTRPFQNVFSPFKSLDNTKPKANKQVSHPRDVTFVGIFAEAIRLLIICKTLERRQEGL
jgi:hypothetical protein